MSNLYYESFLSHHGVLGMKWGVRRYQTSDGRLTHLGRHRNQVKDLKRSERDKTDRTKARLEAQKKKLAYEKSLGPSDHPTRDIIKSKTKDKMAKYDKAISESKRKTMSNEDKEIAEFMKSMAMTSLNAIAKSGNVKKITKYEIKDAWADKITDIKDDMVDRIDNFKFR